MAVSITEPVLYKRLVAAGNDDIYYEDLDVAAGTMTELDTSAVAGQSSGPIDTSDNLNMFELAQKVFIVNGSIKRVADFVNTKLTSTAEITTYLPSHGDILTQDQTGGKYAYMVVDYISAWSNSKHLIYGYAYYAGGATAFTTSHDVLDADSNTVIANANLSTVTEAPHWYDWTVYNGGKDADGNENSFGTMPNKAYLGCNYRGRAVISGDPEHPHQWWMAEQLNPWNFAWGANDAQSPVKGTDADAGEIGDIVRSLIPYKDDYLAIGCATSIWYVAGDPAAGGEINELDLTVGMFGAKSWCFDGKGNLYFFGTNGLYKTTIPGTPICISDVRLPKLVDDEAVDPTTHRITMEYDRVRKGILVCITVLATGVNSNYWYDLQTEGEGEIGGIFPESYPEECGVYSSMFYGANDPDYRELLVGCRDGYIRKFDESAEDDDIGVSDEAIDSYIGFGPLQIHDDPDFEGKITGINIVTAGITTDSNYSDNISCKVYVDKSAEKVTKRMIAGTSPNILKTFKSPGRQYGNKLKHKLKGVYAGIELRNSTAAQTWGFEQLLINAKPAGKAK